MEDSNASPNHLTPQAITSFWSSANYFRSTPMSRHSQYPTECRERDHQRASGAGLGATRPERPPTDRDLSIRRDTDAPIMAENCTVATREGCQWTAFALV